MIYSCTKDSVKTENQDQAASQAELQTLKSILKIGDEETTTLRTVTDCGTPNCTLYLSGVSETVLIPSLGCYALVTYDIYRCWNPGPSPTTVTDIFKNFKAVPIEAMGCTALLNDWAVLYNNGDFIGLAAALDLFNSLASEAVEQKWVNYFFTSQPYMQTFFRCGKPNKYFIEFFMNNCFKWCINFTTASGKPVFDFVRNDCTQNCCKRTRQYCWNLNNTLNIGTPSYIQIGDCVEVQGANCGVGYITAGSCTHKCFPTE
jgi:hypothetical protein